MSQDIATTSASHTGGMTLAGTGVFAAPVKSRLGRVRDTIRQTLDANGAERRWAAVDRAEVRAVREDGSFDFEGHAAVFDQFSEDLGFREIIKRGAFKDVLTDDVRFLFNHDPNLVLARTTSGTLELSEDPKGLLAKADVAPTSYAQDIRLLLDRGDISQMSFGFIVAEDDWVETDDEIVRTISKFAELFDVSVVTYPAYPQTDAQARAFRKLGRGETLGEEEQKAIAPLLRPHSAERGDEERALGADRHEPESEASSPGDADAENPRDLGDRLSGRSARLRVRERQFTP